MAPRFDVEASLEELRGPKKVWLGGSVASRLAQQGFCTVNLNLQEALLSGAAAQAQSLEACGRFSVPPSEVVGGLLGAEGSTEVCQLDCGPSSSEPASLRAVNDVLAALGEALEPGVLQPHLGFATESRSHGLLHAARGVPTKRPALTERQCEHWLDQFVRQRLMAVLFLGPRGGMLRLQPFHGEAEALEIPVEPGTLVIFRADELSRSYFGSPGTGGSSALSCFFSVSRHSGEISEDILIPPAWDLLQWVQGHLGELRAQMCDLEDEDGPVKRALAIPPNWQLAMNHMYSSSRGKQVSVRSASCHFPGGWTFEDFGQGIRAGTDFATEIPRKRWFWEDFYDPDLDSYLDFKTYSMHGVFIEGADLFDNKLFGISNMEAAGMDPTQYLLMETAYEALQMAGFRKKTLMNALIGVYIGQGVVEAAPKDQGVSMGGTGAARAVSCGRISFSLGMQGPCCTLDAHGATAWACVEVGFQSLRNQSKSYRTALAGSVMLNLSPLVFVQNCAAGVLSPIGRCCTFDSSANGYVKSEGASFACLQTDNVVDGQAVQDDESSRLGVIAACEIASLGRSAKLGAPNAAAEQVVVADALRSAELAPLNVEVVECWGDGELLGDAVEASYLGRCLRWEEPGARPLQLGAVMSQVGFMREVAGFAQLLKLLGVLSHGLMTNNLHLCQMNPHADESALESLNITAETVGCRLPSSFCGATSRGLGGTVTHAIIGVQAREAEALPNGRARGLGSTTREGIAYWPAGGGRLEEAAEPSTGYFVQGSWMPFGEPQQMEEEAPEVYGLTVTLGAGLCERFRLLLDGDSARALRPARPEARPGTAAVGPEVPGAAGSRDFEWLLDARESWVPVLTTDTRALEDDELDNLSTQQVVQRRQLRFARDPLAPEGRPGDRFRIRMRVAGRWRMVDWTKLAGDAAGEQPADVRDFRYAVVGSWDWSKEVELLPSGTPSEGVYAAEVTLPQEGTHQFLIVQNGDWDRAFYPMPSECGGAAEDGVLGPDDRGQDLFWTLAGRAGETFRVEFVRKLEHGLEMRSVTWQSQMA